MADSRAAKASAEETIALKIKKKAITGGLLGKIEKALHDAEAASLMEGIIDLGDAEPVKDMAIGALDVLKDESAKHGDEEGAATEEGMADDLKGQQDNESLIAAVQGMI